MINSAENICPSYGRRLADLAAERPGDVALNHVPGEGDPTSYTFAELDQAVNRAARLFASHGVTQGTMVAVALPNVPEHVIATYAAWRLGAGVLPLRWDVPAWERDRQLALAEPALVVTADPATDLDLPAVSAAELKAADFPATPVPNRIPYPARTMATSGSTGAPKLVLLPEPGQYGYPGATPLPRDAFPELRFQQVELIPGPLYHYNGFVNTHQTLQDGERVVLLERFQAERIPQLVKELGVTTFTMAPTMLQRLVRLPDVRPEDFAGVTRVIHGAGPIPPSLIRACIDLFGGDRFMLTYGVSEALGVIAVMGDDWLKRPGTFGRGIKTDLRIVNEDTGAEVPAGTPGRIAMRNLRCSTPTYEYRGTAQPMEVDADGFTITGDIGYLDEDGYLFVLDRRADLIVSGGANVYPAEVEAALSEHPAIADVVVIGMPDEEWGRRVHAIIEPLPSAQPPTREDIRHFCADRIAPYKVPKTVELIDKVPRTEAGKINRQSLIEARTKE